MEFVVDDRVDMTAQQVIDMEPNSVLLFVYDSISYTRVVWIEFETNAFEIQAEFVVPQHSGYQHPIEGSQHLNVQHFLSILVHYMLCIDFRCDRH